MPKITESIIKNLHANTTPERLEITGLEIKEPEKLENALKENSSTKYFVLKNISRDELLQLVKILGQKEIQCEIADLKADAIAELETYLKNTAKTIHFKLICSKSIPQIKRDKLKALTRLIATSRAEMKASIAAEAESNKAVAIYLAEADKLYQLGHYPQLINFLADKLSNLETLKGANPLAISKLYYLYGMAHLNRKSIDEETLENCYEIFNSAVEYNSDCINSRAERAILVAENATSTIDDARMLQDIALLLKEKIEPALLPRLLKAKAILLLRTEKKEEEKNFDLALENINLAINLKPSDLSSYLLIRGIIYFNQNDKRGLEDFCAVINANSSPQNVTIAHYYKARYALKNKDGDTALLDINNFIQYAGSLWPKDLNKALGYIIQDLKSAGKTKEADALLENAKKLFASYAQSPHFFPGGGLLSFPYEHESLKLKQMSDTISFNLTQKKLKNATSDEEKSKSHLISLFNNTSANNLSNAIHFFVLCKKQYMTPGMGDTSFQFSVENPDGKAYIGQFYSSLLIAISKQMMPLVRKYFELESIRRAKKINLMALGVAITTSFPIFKFILEQNQDDYINQTVDGLNKTLLELAIDRECIDSVKLLLAHNAEITKDAILLTIEKDNLPILVLLMERGFDPFARTLSINILEIARKHNAIAIAAFLKEKQKQKILQSTTSFTSEKAPAETKKAAAPWQATLDKVLQSLKIKNEPLTIVIKNFPADIIDAEFLEKYQNTEVIINSKDKRRINRQIQDNFKLKVPTDREVYQIVFQVINIKPVFQSVVVIAPSSESLPENEKVFLRNIEHAQTLVQSLITLSDEIRGILKKLKEDKTSFLCKKWVDGVFSREKFDEINYQAEFDKLLTLKHEYQEHSKRPLFNMTGWIDTSATIVNKSTIEKLISNEDLLKIRLNALQEDIAAETSAKKKKEEKWKPSVQSKQLVRELGLFSSSDERKTTPQTLPAQQVNGAAGQQRPL